MRVFQKREMVKKYILPLFLVFFFHAEAGAQQDPLTSHYMFSHHFFNPAVAGSSGLVCATAVSRQQWAGLEGAPSTTTFTVSSPVKLAGNLAGLGLTARSDKAGFDNDISLAASMSYFISAGTGAIGIGLSAGMFNKTLDPKWVIPSGDKWIPPAGDPLIPESKESFVAFDAGLGVFYFTDKYYAGLSVTHINQPVIKFSKGSPYLTRHYYLTGGYNLILPNPAFEMKPSLLLVSDGRVAQLTVNSLITYNKKAWAGVSYRAGDAVAFMAGVELYNGIRLGYAFDFSLSDMRKNTTGSHEFMVNYCFEIGLGRSPMRYKSVRFL